MLDQIEERRFGPVDVLDDERERSHACACLECLPHGEGDVLRRVRSERGVEVGLGADRREDLAQRPIADAFAVGQAAAGQDNGRVAELVGDLAGET